MVFQKAIMATKASIHVLQSMCVWYSQSLTWLRFGAAHSRQKTCQLHQFLVNLLDSLTLYILILACPRKNVH